MLAKPIYPANLSTEMNILTGYRVLFPKPAAGKVTLRLAAFSIYRAYLNGKFLAHGPARCAKFFYRIDELDLTPHLLDGGGGQNILAIELAGYNMNGYYLTDQPPFLQAEILAGETVIAATGLSDSNFHPFEATHLTHRIQKVQRFSFMRPAIEMYDMTPESNAWRTNPAAPFIPAKIEILPPKRLLPRNVPYPLFNTQSFQTISATGKIAPVKNPKKLWDDRCLTKVGPEFSYKGFLQSEIPLVLSDRLAHLRTAKLTRTKTPITPQLPIKVSNSNFQILDLGREYSGFIGFTVKVTKPTHLVCTFDELLVSGDIATPRKGTMQGLTWKLTPGTYQLESLEPYALRYIKLFTFEGAAEISNPYLREYAHPYAHRTQLATSDETLNALFDAARQTFRLNVIDLFMDNPLRERAGWLCDSFFTAAAEPCLTGGSLVEKNFLEHFLLAEKFETLPDKMIPKCYPADFTTSRYNPQWAMWFILQLEQYLQRSGDRKLVDALRPRVEGVIEFFDRVVNADGLLENIPGESFMEWSKANEMIEGVHFPSNALYAATLEAVSRLYGDKTLVTRATKMRKAILAQGLNKKTGFFVDNCTRDANNKLVQSESTEIAQYFMFFFDVATPKSHPKLWKTLLTHFGPTRRKTKRYPGMPHADMFIGIIMRLCLLNRYQLHQKLLDDCGGGRGYFDHMLRLTGTFWEHTQGTMGCCQGFAAILAPFLIEAATGLSHLDPVHKTLRWSPPELKLAWSTLHLPVANEFIDITWSRTAPPKIHLPAGWTLT